MILCDVLGHLIAAAVHSAGEQERDGARHVLQPIVENTDKYQNLEVILGDAAFGGKLQEWFHRQTLGKKRLQIVKRSDQKGFIPQPKRWVVERTFGWWNWERRLAKDYEHQPKTSKSLLFMKDAFLIAAKLKLST
jgi:hypothetical protein